MHSLQLQPATRNGSHNKKQVEYLDFVVSGRSLKGILGIENADYCNTNRIWDKQRICQANFEYIQAKGKIVLSH